jgi:hypothetical protein
MHVHTFALFGPLQDYSAWLDNIDHRGHPNDRAMVSGSIKLYASDLYHLQGVITGMRSDYGVHGIVTIIGSASVTHNLQTCREQDIDTAMVALYMLSMCPPFDLSIGCSFRPAINMQYKSSTVSDRLSRKRDSNILIGHVV